MAASGKWNFAFSGWNKCLSIYLFLVVILASVLSLLVWGVAGLSDGRIIFEDLDIGHIPRSIFEELEHEEKLSCEQKTYKAYIERKDEQGRKCWDNLLLPACWGRCDSFEVNLLIKNPFLYKLHLLSFFINYIYFPTKKIFHYYCTFLFYYC